MSEPDHIATFNKKRYDTDYTVDDWSINSGEDKKDYFYQMSRVRLELIREYGAHKAVLDVGCGPGDYLRLSSDVIKHGTGVDFSRQFIAEAARRAERAGARNMDFVQGEAARLPFRSCSFDMVFTDSVLEITPGMDKAILEIGRVIQPGGVAVIGLGNSWSMNHIVCRAYPEHAVTCHIPVWRMKAMIRAAVFRVIKVRSFNLLPYWGGRPRWLRPLLRPFWKKFMQKKWHGKMLDEWVSGLPLVRLFVFRHLWIVRKMEMK